MLFLMSLTTFSSCVGAERVVTVVGLACQSIGLHGTDRDSHVKRVLTWSDCTDFDTGLFLPLGGFRHRLLGHVTSFFFFGDSEG